jgi:tetratricopeptide (TPR) repeat protein
MNTKSSRVLWTHDNVVRVAFNSRVARQVAVDAEVTALMREQEVHDLFVKACDLDDAGRNAEAEALYIRVIKLDDRHAGAHTNLGTIYYERGDKIGALVFFERGRERDHLYWVAHYNIGYVHFVDERYELAIKNFALATACDEREATDAHLYAGESYHRTGRPLQARACWLAYLRYTSDDEEERGMREHVKGMLGRQ